MKRVYEGFLLLAFVLVGMYGMGNVDDGVQVFVSATAMVVLAKLMSMAGMMDRAIRKSK